MADARIMLGDYVRRTDQDWGEGTVIGVVVGPPPELEVEYRVSWGDVVGWVPDAKLVLVGVPEPHASGSAPEPSGSAS